MQDVTLSEESVFGLPMHRWKNEDHGDDSEMQHLPTHPACLKSGRFTPPEVNVYYKLSLMLESWR
ncbi:MAG: hypothetical protein FGF48_04400 [Candidatus Brockarchaeota archaeon]|nr:hypothetical protein [Candidatus Brockarchaeota archaeon]